MRNTLKKLLVMMLALTLLASLALPSAMAEKANKASFESTAITTYTGMKTALPLLDAEGVELKPGNYKWTTSNKKVVTVSAGGVITAQKAGTAKITATSKTDKKDVATVKVTVSKNKVDKLNAKPSPSSISSYSIAMCLKSVEIVSPKKVVCEYYYVQNLPSNYKLLKVDYVKDTLIAREYDGDPGTKMVSGKVKNIKASAKGKAVKTIKVTYSGSMVKDTNFCLKKLYSVCSDGFEGRGKYKY